MITIDKATVENLLLDWLHDLGCAVAHGPDIAPD